LSEDTLKKRYLSKLASNFVKFAIGFATLGMVPRALGAEAYGNFGFLTNFFQNTMKFIKTGGPTPYYTKLSKRQDEKKLIGFFIYYAIVLVIFVFISLLGVFKLGLQGTILPNQKGVFIFAAALLAVLYFIIEFFRNTNDALGYTFKYEIAFIFQSILTAGLIVGMYFTGILTISSYFIMHYLLSFFVIILGWRILRVNKIYLSKQMSLAKDEVFTYIKEFYHYSHPLIIQALVVYVVVIVDRWLLQKYYGSMEQGYYTLALSIGSMIFLFTSSMSPLFLREMSLSYKDREKKDMRRLFRNYIPLFYFITAYFGVFISLNADTASIIIGGAEYKNASMVITVMALLPLHQTYGQLAGAVLLANENTKIIRNIGVSTGLIGLLISYLLLMPAEHYGFEMGAIGLAIKMLLTQFILVTIYLWFTTRFLNLSFYKFLGHQILVIALLLMLTKFSQHLTAFITTHILINFLISGVIYTVFVLMLIIIYPRIIVMTRRDFNHYVNMTLGFIKNRLH